MTREGIYAATQPRASCDVLEPLRHAQPCEPVRRLDSPRPSAVPAASTACIAL